VIGCWQRGHRGEEPAAGRGGNFGPTNLRCLVARRVAKDSAFLRYDIDGNPFGYFVQAFIIAAKVWFSFSLKSGSYPVIYLIREKPFSGLKDQMNGLIKSSRPSLVISIRIWT
jgi:hypothetical protein